MRTKAGDVTPKRVARKIVNTYKAVKEARGPMHMCTWYAYGHMDIEQGLLMFYTSTSYFRKAPEVWP